MTKQDFIELFSGSDSNISETKDREKSLEYIKTHELPNKTDENWRNTDLRPLVEQIYFSAQTQKNRITSINELKINGLNDNCLVFINGSFQKELSKIENDKNNIFLGSLAEGKKMYPDIFNKYFNQSEKEIETVFTALNTAYAQNGAFIYVSENFKSQKPIQILSISESESQSTAYQIRNLIILAKNSEVNVITVSKSLSDGISFCNSQNEIFLEANSTLNFNIFQEENIETRSLNNTRLKQSENTQSTVNIASLSGAILRNDIKIYLSGENARTEINGIYLPTNEQQFDNYILIEHEKSHGKSRQLFKGIIDGQARSVFSGRVLVDKNAQKTDAGQLNKNLLLTDYAKAYSRPQLEIYADDVQCSHGSSTGQIDKEALFYLQSRGIGEKQAKILMLNAFAKEVIDKISIPEYKNYIENLFENKYF